MLLQTAPYSQLSHWSDLTTCIYIALIIKFYHQMDILYSLGSYKYIHVIILLAVAEIIKYFLYYRTQKPKISLKYIAKFVACLVIPFVAFYIAAVSLGAPVFFKYEETTMFSLLLSVLVTLPTCLHLGPDNATHMFLSLFSVDADVNELLLLKNRLTLFGAWLGAIVIPLDWNRPWQKWPIPCYLGAIVGYAAANLIIFIQHFVHTKPNKRTRRHAL